MDRDTPITIAAAKYSTHDLAERDFDDVWAARGRDEFDHTAVAVLTKDSSGNLAVDRHDSTAKHLAWGGALLGAALVVVAPPVGAAALVGSGAGAGALVGHFHHNIPKEFVREAGDLLESGESGLIVVAVNKKGSDIGPLMTNAEKTTVVDTVWGDLDETMEKELAEAKATAGAQV